MNYFSKKLLVRVFTLTVCLTICAAEQTSTCPFTKMMAGIGGVVAVVALFDAYTMREKNKKLTKENQRLDSEQVRKSNLKIEELRAENSSLRQQNNILLSEVQRCTNEAWEHNNSPDALKKSTH